MERGFDRNDMIEKKKRCKKKSCEVVTMQCRDRLREIYLYEKLCTIKCVSVQRDNLLIVPAKFKMFNVLYV